MENQEREISLLSLFRYLLKRWRSIVFIAIIFALFFTALSHFMEIKRLSTPVEQIEENMTADEKATVYKIKAMDKELEDLNYYIENSAVMNMDPYNIQWASVSYFVDTKHVTNYAGDTESDLIWDIMAIYVSKLNSMGWKAEALRESGSDIELKYFNEMVSVSTSGRNFTVTIKYPDPDQLKIIMDVLQKSIQKFKEDISVSIGTHSLALTDSSKESAVLDRELKAFQEDKKYQLSSTYEEILNLKNTMNEKQKILYYGRALSKSELNTGILSDEPPQAGISLKKFVLGGFLGGFIMLVIYLLRYILQDRFHVEDNIKSSLGVTNLGYAELHLKRKPNFINRKIRNSELKVLDGLNSDEQFSVILSNIRQKFSDARMLYISGPKEDKLAADLSQSLNNSGICCQAVSNIMRETDAVNNQCGVVFIVRTDYSTYPQLFREINFCNIHGAKVLGVAVEIS